MGLSLAMGCYLLIGLGLVQVTGRCFLGKAPGNEIVAAIPFSRLNDFTFLPNFFTSFSRITFIGIALLHLFFCHLNDLRNQVLGLGALNLDTGYSLMTAAAEFFHHGLDIDGPVTAGRNTDAIVALIENGADMDIIHGQQLIGCLGDNNGNIAVILGTAGMNRNSKTRNGFLHFRNDLGPEDNRGVIFFKKLGYGMRIGTIAPQIGRGLKGPFTGLDSKVLGVNNDPSIKDGGLQRADFPCIPGNTAGFPATISLVEEVDGSMYCSITSSMTSSARRW